MSVSLFVLISYTRAFQVSIGLLYLTHIFFDKNNIKFKRIKIKNLYKYKAKIQTLFGVQLIDLMTKLHIFGGYELNK